MELEIKNWKPFKIDDVIKREKIKSISKILQDLPSGNINVVGNSSMNNGVIAKININDKKYIHRKNTLSYGAKGGKFFWQETDWVSTDHVHLFSSPFLNKNNQLFICTILNKLIDIKGGWSSSLESNIVNEIIYLPTNSIGDPDWEYMENYIKKLREREREDSELAKPLVINKYMIIDNKPHKEFSFLNFNLYSSKNSLDKNKIIDDGTHKIYPYITRTENNNGIHSFISKQNIEINNGNCLTIGLDTQTCFYQEKPFYTGQNVHILRINGANKYSYLFIATIIKKKIKQLFSWGSNGATLGRLKQEKILLPIKIDGTIDFEYMDNYIKSLPYSKYL